MIEVAALMLCKLGGQGGSEAEIKAVLEAAGLEANDDLIAKLVGDVEGKDINELLAEGMAKVKDIPLGGGGGGGGGGGAAADSGAAAAAPAEEEKEEEEMDLGGGMDMFGGEEGGGGGGGGDY